MCALFERLPKRILIVDDDIDLLMLLERCLDREGYAVETAASLTEAEEILPQFFPHLVLLDINVNGEDGRKLCWKLKNATATPFSKVIVMSGYDCNTGRAVLFGADDFITKPLHSEYLLHRMDLLLESSTNTTGKTAADTQEERE